MAYLGSSEESAKYILFAIKIHVYVHVFIYFFLAAAVRNIFNKSGGNVFQRGNEFPATQFGQITWGQAGKKNIYMFLYKEILQRIPSSSLVICETTLHTSNFLTDDG